MIVETGHFLFILSIIIASVQFIVPKFMNKGDMIGLTYACQILQGILCFGAFGILINAFLGSDFSVFLVYLHSHRALPFYYKIAALWGNHEGSMLLWYCFFQIAGILFLIKKNTFDPVLKVRILSDFGLFSLLIGGYILLYSNPFLRTLKIPFEGRGFNPLLQDPALVIHPPLLYLSYALISLLFCLTVAFIRHHVFYKQHALYLRFWALAAWGVLTAAIMIGSFWAYYELGWGGWWFWDPVENISLIPWLLMTACFHNLMIVEKRGLFKYWAVTIIALSFFVVLTGSFVIRSGLLSSVHSFALDPKRGYAILVISILLFAYMVIYTLLNRKALKSPHIDATYVSKEFLLLGNSVLMIAASLTILFATLFPLLYDLFLHKTITVGAPYFEKVLSPMASLTAVLMVFGSWVHWKGDTFSRHSTKAIVTFGLTFIIISIAYHSYKGLGFYPVLSIAIGAFVVIGTLVGLSAKLIHRSEVHAGYFFPSKYYAMILAHIGIGIVFIGMGVASGWKSEMIVKLKKGEGVFLRGYEITLLDVDYAYHKNFETDKAILSVHDSHSTKGFMYPERRLYFKSDSQTVETDILHMIKADLYAILGDYDRASKAWVIKLYYYPFIFLIWGGAFCLIISAFFLLIAQRFFKDKGAD